MRRSLTAKQTKEHVCAALAEGVAELKHPQPHHPFPHPTRVFLCPPFGQRSAFSLWLAMLLLLLLLLLLLMMIMLMMMLLLLLI